MKVISDFKQFFCRFRLIHILKTVCVLCVDVLLGHISAVISSASSISAARVGSGSTL